MKNNKIALGQATAGWAASDVIVGSCYITWVCFRGSVDRGGDTTAFSFLSGESLGVVLTGVANGGAL